MKKFKQHILIIIALVSSITSLQSTDLQHFYRANIYQNMFDLKTNDWYTHLAASGSYGKTNDSWNQDNHKTSLFNAHGNFQINQLLENISDEVVAGSATDTWLKDMISTYADASFEFKGKFNIKELAIDLHQNLLWGFYLHAFTQIKRFKIRDISIINRTNTSEVTAGQLANIETFKDDYLDTVLSDTGIQPIKTPY